MRLKSFNEKYYHDKDYHFITEVDDVGFEQKHLGIEDVDWIDVITCKVYWKYDLDYNEGGIDGILPSVMKIGILVEVYTYNEETDFDDMEEKEFEFSWDKDEFDEKSRDYDGRQILPFYPRSIEVGRIEEKTKVTIHFDE